MIPNIIRDLPTQLGDIQLTLTNGNHIHVSEKNDSLTLRNVQYHVSLHLYAPNWKVKESYISRKNDWKTASPAAIKTIHTTIEEAVRVFVNLEGQNLLEQAERNSLKDRIASIEDEINEKQKEIDELKKERDTLRTKLLL